MHSDQSPDRMMITLTLLPGQADLDSVKVRLHLADAEIDQGFGLVEVSPKRHLYAIRIDVVAAARVHRQHPEIAAWSDLIVQAAG